MIAAREVAEFRPGGHGHGALDAPQGLQRFDDRREAPCVSLLLKFLFKTPQAFRVFGNRADIFLKDNVLGRGRTAHLSEPPEVGWTPVGRARVTDVLPEQEGLETALGRLAVPQGLFAGPAEIPDGVIFHRGDIHGRAIT
jgi:hypothetical protein